MTKQLKFIYLPLILAIAAGFTYSYAMSSHEEIVEVEKKEAITAAPMSCCSGGMSKAKGFASQDKAENTSFTIETK